MYLMQYPMPRSYFFFQILLQTVAVMALRFSYRFLRYLKEVKEQKFGGRNKWKNVMIIGAGEAGKTIIKEIVDSKFLTMRVCCVVDDDLNKAGRYINGADCRNRSILRNVEKYEIDTIILALPSASLEEKKNILEICKMTARINITSGNDQLIDGELNVSKFQM